MLIIFEIMCGLPTWRWAHPRAASIFEKSLRRRDVILFIFYIYCIILEDGANNHGNTSIIDLTPKVGVIL